MLADFETITQLSKNYVIEAQKILPPIRKAILFSSWAKKMR
jgi:hypothetical protein